LVADAEGFEPASDQISLQFGDIASRHAKPNRHVLLGLWASRAQASSPRSWQEVPTGIRLKFNVNSARYTRPFNSKVGQPGQL
jgi:hypothetical protein